MKKIPKLDLDLWFWQLLDLADEGDENAPADLFQKYEFIYGVDEVPEQEVDDE